jgi:hypothetical protein
MINNNNKLKDDNNKKTDNKSADEFDSKLGKRTRRNG